MTIRVLLADSHQITRDGLYALFLGVPEFEVIGQAADGRAAVEQVDQLRPDMVVTEIALSELNGIEATRRIVSGCPTVRVLILSCHSERRFIAAALQAGASGYLHKTCGFDELALALRVVARGQPYLSPAIAQSVIDHFVQHGAATDPLGDPSLTPREREVLQLLAEGQSTKGIATSLQVSAKTVETHRRSIMAKLNLYSIAELTRYALREGITSL